MPGRRPHEHLTIPTHPRIPRRFPPKVLSFIVEYVINQNATQAAIRAGYSAKSAHTTANRLLKKETVTAEIDRRLARKTLRVDFKAEDILEELRRLALFDPRAVFDGNGNLRPIHEWTAEQASCLASFEIIKKNAEAGDGKIDLIHKVKFWSKDKAIELAAKHFALLTEKVEHTGGIEITWQLPTPRRDAQLPLIEGQALKQLESDVRAESAIGDIAKENARLSPYGDLVPASRPTDE